MGAITTHTIEPCDSNLGKEIEGRYDDTIHRWTDWSQGYRCKTKALDIDVDQCPKQISKHMTFVIVRHL